MKSAASNNNDNFITEPEKRIPVYKRVDVLVAGSGPGGLGAAISAARNGANTLLVERHSFLGGMATASLQNWRWII
jgi:NADPH-dependent 2,4-dienoyl-CoA reductase/sulfur reductase-like enzyme